MRLVDVVLAGVLIGLVIGLGHMAQPGPARADVAPEANPIAGERLTWLRTPPMMRRAASVQ